MTVLRELKATPATEDFTEPGEHHHQIGVSLGDGSIRYIRLGPAGLTIGDLKTQVAIARDELLALAEPFLGQQR